MSTYTQADVDAVKAAIVALARGDRKATVSFADRSVSYQPAQLPELQQLLVTMQADVAAGARPRQYVAVDNPRW